jgi:hypothetical protein
VVYSTGFLIVGGLLSSVFVTKLRQLGFSSVGYSPTLGNDVTFNRIFIVVYSSNV